MDAPPRENKVGQLFGAGTSARRRPPNHVHRQTRAKHPAQCRPHGDIAPTVTNTGEPPSHQVLENVPFEHSSPQACQRLSGGCARSIGKHSTGEPPSHQVLENVTFEQRQPGAAQKTKQTINFWLHSGAGDISLVLKWTTAELGPECRSAQPRSGGNSIILYKD